VLPLCLVNKVEYIFLYDCILCVITVSRICKKKLIFVCFGRYEEKYFIRMSTPKKEKVSQGQFCC